jgi:molybdopterin molybdotransferase
VGVDPVPVLRRLVWALASTGDELVEVSSTPEPWQIRRSNAQAIAGEAWAWGLAPSTQRVLPDDQGRLRAGVEELLAGLDVLVLTGGVSAGKMDLVPEVLAQLGCQTVFHQISQRPGKPLWCGILEGTRPTVIFGLPGNPVSSLFAFRRYVLPWLLGAEGRRPRDQRVPVAGLTVPPAGQTVFLPWSQTDGLLTAKGSGDFLSLARSTGFIEVSDEPSLNQPLYYPWGGCS